MSRRAAYLKLISYAKSSCWLAEGSGEQITQVPALFAGAGKTSEQKYSVYPNVHASISNFGEL
jgi:hypothetical protein